MSRLQSMSPAALRAVFSPESSDTLIVLITLSGGNITSPIYLADNYTKRLYANDEEVAYGLTSRGIDYYFLPFSMSLPTEEDAAPRAQLTINDVNGRVLPHVRRLQTAPTVKIELVLASNPDYVEVDFGEFLLANISYSGPSITGELTLESFEMEPFPCDTFTPSYFPGLF